MMNVKAFECFLIVGKGLQAITVHGYVGTARRFTNVVGEFPSEQQAMEYMRTIYQSNYSYSHKLNTALGVEKYMEFIGKSISLGRQKKPKPIIKNTLTEAEVTKLIFNCKNIREKAIVTLLAYSGIRNKELCGIKVRDFNPGDNTIRVLNGKGLKDGISNISSDCTIVLLEYIKQYNRQPDDFLFVTLRDKKQYTGYALRKLVHVLAKRSKMEKRVYPHLFRHSLAVNLLSRGAHVVLLQRQLRHTLLETTLHYINSIVFSEKNTYEKFAPSYI